MKLLKCFFLLLISSSLCMAHQGKRTDDLAFEEMLLKLLRPLQQKRLPEYLPGTEVTVQDFKDGEPYGPEIKSVLKAPLPGYAEAYQSYPLREPLPTKPDDNDPANIFRPRPAEIQIDGHTVQCILRAEPVFEIIPIAFYGQGSTVSSVKRQWLLAAEPKIVLREEYVYVQWDKWFWHTSPSSWWAVTSVGVKKKVGDLEYRCVELKHDFYFASDGYTITTHYVNSDIPGFVVEREEVFYQIGKDRKKNYSFVRTWKMLNIKFPAKTSKGDGPTATGISF